MAGAAAALLVSGLIVPAFAHAAAPVAGGHAGTSVVPRAGEATVSGNVFRPNGDAATHGLVELTALDENGDPDYGQSTTTSISGTGGFSFSEVVEGDYRLRASWLGAGRCLSDIGLTEASGEGETVQVSVDGELSGVELPVPDIWKLFGTVVDSYSQPVGSGIELVFLPTAFRVYTDTDGQFTTCVNEGTSTLYARSWISDDDVIYTLAEDYSVDVVGGDREVTIQLEGGEPPAYVPEASVSPEEVTESELAATGVTITGVGFPGDADVTLTVAGAEVETATADAGGEVSFGYTSDSLGVGTHAVALTSGSLAAEASFTVREDPVDPDPETIPGTAPSEGDLDPSLEGAITAPAEATPGETITVTVNGVDPGTEIGAWLFSAPVYLGTHTVDGNAQVTVTIPADAELGDTKLAVWAAPDTQVGWTAITIVDGEGDDDGSDSGDGDGSDSGGGGTDSGTDDGSGDDSGDSLPDTGTASVALAATAGAMLLMLGAALALWRRRGALG